MAVEAKDGTLLYSGYLDKYVLTKDEKLDRIYLTAVRRRKLADDVQGPPGDLPAGAAEVMDYSESATDAAPTDGEAPTEFDLRYYFMPGHYFMIPGAEIKNINITYLLKDVEAPAEAAA